MTETSFTPVRQVMTPDPQVVDGLATVEAAMALMRQRQISSLVIDKRHPGDEYGLVVVADIASKVIGQDRALERTNVYEIMSKPVISVEGGMDIKYAIRLLDRFGVSRALVLEQGRLVGLVTMRDMVLRHVES